MKRLTEKMMYGTTTFLSASVKATVRIALIIIGREMLLRNQAETHAVEQAQREIQQRMNEFLSIASHELRTPLTSIKGNIQLLGRRLKHSLEANAKDAEGEASAIEASETNRLLMEAKELLERTDKQVTQLSRLVQTLLESARINANTIDLLLEQCELETLVHEVVHQDGFIPATRTVHVEVLSEQSILILADVNRIKQVIVHYLSNAHKFSPLDQAVDVSVRVEGEMVRVSVHDAGPGIAPHEHNKIWERFYRIPDIEVQNGSEVGLGLGLHICRTVIEQHNGQVGVQSKPGTGSTFWFTLPMVGKEMNKEQ